jgi:hypothetical protein
MKVESESDYLRGREEQRKVEGEERVMAGEYN